MLEVDEVAEEVTEGGKLGVVFGGECDDAVEVFGGGGVGDGGEAEERVEVEGGEVVEGLSVGESVEAEASGTETVAPAGEPGAAVSNAMEEGEVDGVLAGDILHGYFSVIVFNYKGDESMANGSTFV